MSETTAKEGNGFETRYVDAEGHEIQIFVDEKEPSITEVGPGGNDLDYPDVNDELILPDPRQSLYSIFFRTSTGLDAHIRIPDGINLDDWNKLNEFLRVCKPKQRRQRKKADNAE